MFDYDGRPVGEEAQESLLKLFEAFEQYVGETVYSLTEKDTDRSLADTIAAFLQSQARAAGALTTARAETARVLDPHFAMGVVSRWARFSSEDYLPQVIHWI